MFLLNQYFNKFRIKCLVCFWLCVVLNSNRNSLFSQNISMLSLPVTMNKIAGEFNSFDAFQIISNPANLESIKKFDIGFFGERKFNLNQLSNYALVAGYSLAKFKIGLTIQKSGTTLFNQNAVSLCLSKKIGKDVAIAIQSGYFQNNILARPNQKQISAQFGIVGTLSNSVKIGFTAINYASLNKLTSATNSYNILISTGIFYAISNQFSMSVNGTKISNLPNFYTATFNYKAHKRVELKLGFMSNGNTTNFELLFHGKKMSWSLIMSFHPNLGISPGSSICTNSNN